MSNCYVKPFERKVTVNGQEWSYRVKEDEFVVLSPNGKKLFKRKLDFSKSGIKEYSDYCGFMFRIVNENARGEITPARIVKFIKRVCL